jgi:hypothetical protein
MRPEGLGNLIKIIHLIGSQMNYQQTSSKFSLFLLEAPYVHPEVQAMFYYKYSKITYVMSDWEHDTGLILISVLATIL